MRASDEALNLIKSKESFSATVYICPSGIPTIGWGHAVLPNEFFTSITKEQGTDLLRKDVTIAENCINKAVKVPLSQNQFDALVSFVFNNGVNAFLKSTMLRELNNEE